LRIVASFLFILFGTLKLFAFPVGMPPDGGTARLFTEVGIGGLLEVVGGALLLVGLFTRPVAFVLSGEMAVAYFQFAFPKSIWPVSTTGRCRRSIASSSSISRRPERDRGASTRRASGGGPTEARDRRAEMSIFEDPFD